MKNILLLIFIVIPFFVLSQETQKRLALVIGNSSYEKGVLKNPVNDARLMASTLDSLNFDVILKENIETRTEFIRAVREFGTKRPAYDVAFVYYAGHGIQVDDENFLLPTKEEFSSEEDVLDFAVSVQNIMRYLKSQTNEVNILILDACRDNPFESTWNATRSLKGQGLAKIPPPTGSLIAFSTDSGQTAPDGDGENSIYSISLAKNMLLEDTSIDQVFRNVRAEVLDKTNKVQRPVEYTQLTGQGFYFKKPNADLYIKNINKLIINKKFKQGLELSNISIFLYPENSKLLSKRGHLNTLLGNNSEAFDDYLKAIQIEPSESEAYFMQINFKDALEDVGIIQHMNLVELGEETNIFNNWIKNDDKNAIALQERARYYNWDLGVIDWEDKTGDFDTEKWERKYKDLALKDLHKALEILENPKNHYNSSDNFMFYDKSLNLSDRLYSGIYTNISYVLQEQLNFKEALKYVDLSILKNQKTISIANGWSFFSKASILELQGKLNNAIKIYFKSIENMPGEQINYLRIAGIYNTLGNYDLALENFNYAVKLANQFGGKYKDRPIFQRAIFNYTNQKYFLALEDLNMLEYSGDYSSSRIHLIKALIYNDLDEIILAKRDLKKYLLGCCFYDVDSGENWFQALANYDDLMIPFKGFHKLVYSKDKRSQSIAPRPWKGKGDLENELKVLIIKAN